MPVLKLSRHRTLCPAPSSLSTRWDPRKPAPPVTRMRFPWKVPEEKSVVEEANEAWSLCCRGYDVLPLLMVLLWRWENDEGWGRLVVSGGRVILPLGHSLAHIQI